MQNLFYHERFAVPVPSLMVNTILPMTSVVHFMNISGKKEAIDLMRYVDVVNVAYGGQNTKMCSTAGTKFKKLCMQNKLKLLVLLFVTLVQILTMWFWKTFMPN